MRAMDEHYPALSVSLLFLLFSETSSLRRQAALKSDHLPICSSSGILAFPTVRQPTSLRAKVHCLVEM
jgi:hypothetical protein